MLPETVRWQRFSVPYEYPVYFTRGLFDAGSTVLVEALARQEPERRHRFVCFIDSGVLASRPDLADEIDAHTRRHGERIELVAPPVVLPGGEQIKNDPRALDLVERTLLDAHIDRHSFVVAIGGGALLDAVGFVAATFHRGVRLIRVPTTVLAQNDSGVGVKNGVNQHGVKNLIGTFAPPFAVLNDLDFLAGLEPRDRRAGMAEAVKVALIRDARFFEWLEAHADALRAFEPDPMRALVERCAELHMRQIAQGGDPFETGSARPLDYGHWSAHKLESMSSHRLRHGEAVAIGLAIDARYSVLAGHLPAGGEERVVRLLERLGFTLSEPTLASLDANGERAVLAGIDDFREHLGGELTITLLAAIGTGVEVHAIDRNRMVAAIEWLERRASAPPRP